MSATTTPIHDRLEARLQADVRLMYGFGVPMLLIVGLVVVLAITESWYLLPALGLLLIALTGIVVAGIMQMMREDDSGDDST